MDLALEIPPHAVSGVRASSPGRRERDKKDLRERKKERMNKERKSSKTWVERARCSYEFHGRASLLRLLKTVEMLVPAKKETGGEAREGAEGRNGAVEGGTKKKGKECESWRVRGSTENRANLGPGHAREISAYGEITPRREISPRGEFRRVHVKIRYGVISILKVTAVY